MQETDIISVTTMAKMLHGSITASDNCSAAKMDIVVSLVVIGADKDKSSNTAAPHHQHRYPFTS